MYEAGGQSKERGLTLLHTHSGISKEFNLKFLAQSLAVDTQQQDVLSNFHAYNTVLSCVQIIVPIASSGRKYMFVL